jgi:hypothetical protein
VNLVVAHLRSSAGQQALAAGGLTAQDVAGGSVVLTPRFVDSRHVVVLVLDARGRVRVVGKVVRAPGEASTLDREAEVLAATARRGPTGGSAAGAGIPALLALDWVGGHRMLVQSAVPGRPVTHSDARRGSDRWFSAVAGWLDSLVLPEPAARDTGWVERYLSPGLGMARQVLAADAELLSALEHTVDHLGVLAGSGVPATVEHGDLSHPNVLFSAAQGVCVVDWENGQPDGLVGPDAAVFATFLEFAGAGVHGTAPELAAYAERVLADDSPGRARLAGYLAGHGIGPESVDLVLLAAWARIALATFPRLLSSTDPGAADPRTATARRAASLFRQARPAALWQATLDRLDSA